MSLVYDASKRGRAARAAAAGCRVHSGPQGLIELATLAGADMVLVAIVGTAG
jgi:1-deoxy-D-xylulose-5-phosphate reductoisomerase